MNEYETTVAPDDDFSGWHPVQVTHLIFGVVFLAFAGIWALLKADITQIEDLRWLLSVPWLLAGAAGLMASAVGRRARAERRRERDPYSG